MSGLRILVAGIGNIFLGDDAFGVEVVRQLRTRPLPADVRVIDFGIRGLDLAYALLEPYETVVMVDAAPRRQAPGTLYVIEPELAADHASMDAHGMDPEKVLRLAMNLGGTLPRVLLVGCEPVPLDEQPEASWEMSPAVQAAVGPAVQLLESLIAQLLAAPPRCAPHSVVDLHHA